MVGIVGVLLPIEEDLLRNPCFDLSRWYTVRWVQALNLNGEVTNGYKGPMGHAVRIVARKLLTDGIHTYYLCEHPDQNTQTHFEICQRVMNRDKFLITNKH